MAEILSPTTTIDSEVTLAKNDNYLDMNQQEIKQIVIHKVANSTMPATPVNGQMVYNTEKNKYGMYQNGAWAWSEKMPDTLGSANRLLGVNNAGTALEYKELQLGSGMGTIVHGANSMTINLPQQIETNSNVQFGTVTLAAQTNPADNEAVTKKYVTDKMTDLQAGIKVRTTCACATTANITLSGLPIIDGYQVLASDRILVKNQTTAQDNGVYVASATAWSRATDFDTWNEYVGSHVYVEYGTVNSDCGFMCDAAAGGTLGTTAINYTQFSKIGRVDAGNGITKEGNTISVNADTDNTLKFNSGVLAVNLHSNGGLVGNANGIGLSVDTATFEIISNVLKMKAGVGVAEQTISIPACTKDVITQIDHTLGKKPKSIRFYKTATGDLAIPEITEVTTTYIKVKFSRATTSGEFSVDLMAGK